MCTDADKQYLLDQWARHKRGDGPTPDVPLDTLMGETNGKYRQEAQPAFMAQQENDCQD